MVDLAKEKKNEMVMIIERKLKKSKCQRVQNSDEIYFTINFEIVCV